LSDPPYYWGSLRRGTYQDTSFDDLRDGRVRDATWKPNEDPNGEPIGDYAHLLDDGTVVWQSDPAPASVAVGLPDRCETCDLPYAPYPTPPGTVCCFGAVLDARPGEVCVWVPGRTPDDGAWMPPPVGLPEQLRPSDSTFDVVIPAGGDLAAATYYHQRRGHDTVDQLRAELLDGR
jgi:hypothetical protein